ncbi:hypothetical protein ETB97_009356, partial [Aspergillus alliaceus]
MSVNNLDPQAEIPVPEGILNYNGINQVAGTLWGLDERAVLAHLVCNLWRRGGMATIRGEE